ncbi:MAG: anti-sigma factor [Chloroflexota bacterium]
MDRNILLDLIPAYALGALDPDERTEVEAFLATDEEARTLLAEYQAFTDSLVLTTPARRAPAHLNADLRQRLAASRPQPAAVPKPEPTLVPPAAATPAPARPALQRRRPTWVPYVAAAAMIALVFAAVLLLRSKPAPPDDPAQRYEWIMSQDNIRHIPIAASDPSPNTEGELVLTADGQYGVIEVWQLPPIQTDQTFQLWLIDDQGAHSGGLLEFPQTQGPNYINVPLTKPADDYKAIGVSIEPSGGSPKADGPSGPRIFGISVSA